MEGLKRFFSSALISDQEANKGGFSSWVFSWTVWIDGWWFTTQWTKLWGMDYMLSAKDNDQSSPVLNPDPLEPVNPHSNQELLHFLHCFKSEFWSISLNRFTALMLKCWLGGRTAVCPVSESQNLLIRTLLFGTQCANLHLQMFYAL